MASTVTATLFKNLKSKADSVVATHSPASPEVITLNHCLRVCPNDVRVVLRSVHAYGGGIAASPALQPQPQLSVRSWNASQVILDGVGGGGAGWAAGSPWVGAFDIVAEKWHSFDG